MEYGSKWEFYIAKDEFQLYFPEGEYTIQKLAKWYNVIPTSPEKISYYGLNDKELLKQHFSNFCNFGDIKTKLNNDRHSNNFLMIWCMAIYNMESEVVGFAAQEYSDKGPGEKKILYFNDLNTEEYCFMV